MADTTVHLVEHVLPEVRVRQWVCSLPWRLRVLLGYDRRLAATVLGAFAGEVSRSLKRRAKARLGLKRIADAKIGAVTFIQRFDSGQRLDVHFLRIVEPEAARAGESAADVAGFNVHASVVVDGGTIKRPIRDAFAGARLSRLIAAFDARPPIAMC